MLDRIFAARCRKKRTAWLGFDADLEHSCVSVPEAKLAALRAMLQITGVATHLNAWFIAS